MTTFTDDMTNVPDASVAVTEGIKHFRVSKFNLDEGEGTDGANRFNFILTVQTEGQDFGRTVFYNCDMGDARGRSNLKSLYKVCGYDPGPEGHDPERCLDAEFYGTVKHTIAKKDGQTYANVMPWTLKPVVG